LHAHAYEVSGEFAYALFAAVELLLVVLYAIRTKAFSVSRQPAAWFFALGATFAPLLLTPAPDTFAQPLSAYGIYAGVLLQISALMFLGRSFSIVAARRRIVTSGWYAVIRHPMYVAIMLIVFFYTVGNPTFSNAAVLLVVICANVIRIRYEEYELQKDDGYRIYCTRVLWRLFPGVW
jgi:protein-S-isoprenylcysteine O-methyltransferase Ste14